MGATTVSGEGAGDVHERARQGVEHLQAAARELIAAARAALDVAEDVVNDPESLAAVAGVFASFGDLAKRVSGADPRTEPGDDRAKRVERITVV